MTNKFIFKSERFLGENLISFNDNGTIQTSTLNFTNLEKFLNFFVNSESASRSNLMFSVVDGGDGS